MKTYAIVLPLIVLAFAVGLIVSTEGSPIAIFLAPAAQEDNKVGFLGHVEFVHKNALGEIIGYFQSDNLIMDRGNDCISELGFDSANTGGACSGTPAEFQHIGVGDATCVSCEVTTRNTLQNEIGARRADTSIAAFTGSAGAGTTVVINTETPFTFTAVNETNNIFEAGLFDTGPTIDTGNAFAIRNVTATSPNPGIDVNNGDTLDVTWTITVG